MIRISHMDYSPALQRYEVDFTDGKYTWTKFLNDEVYADPLRFKSWLSSLVQDTQLKGK